MALLDKAANALLQAVAPVHRTILATTRTGGSNYKNLKAKNIKSNQGLPHERNFWTLDIVIGLPRHLLQSISTMSQLDLVALSKQVQSDKECNQGCLLRPSPLKHYILESFL